MGKTSTTKEKILAAARTLFVQHGFAGTSMGKIAKLAEVNHSLLFHHFGDKEKLWSAVKLSIVQDEQCQSRVLPSTSLPFKQFLHQLFVQGIQLHKSNPDLLRIINWQRLELAADKLELRPSSESKKWREAFMHYQSIGEMDASLDLNFVVPMVVAVITSAAFDKNLLADREKQLDQYVTFCVERFIRAFS